MKQGLWLYPRIRMPSDASALSKHSTKPIERLLASSHGSIRTRNSHLSKSLNRCRLVQGAATEPSVTAISGIQHSS